MTRFSLNPELLRWARERSGIAHEKLVKKFRKLPEWESGEKQPSLKQLERFAQTVQVPIGYLFLFEPPEERLPIADFRTLKEPAKTKASPNLIETLYAMQRRQEWLQERLLMIGADPLAFTASASLADDPSEVGRKMRTTLELDAGWAKVRTWKEAVSALRHRIEQLGVIAVINGVVENNTRRRLDVKEFRGFALTDSYAPLIFVNGADAKSAQMFTLAHELAHIWLGKEGLSGFEKLLPGGTKVEDWCNQAAAEFLVPSQELRYRWNQIKREQNPFEALGRSFKVSPVVAARRAWDLKLIKRSDFFDFYERYLPQEARSGTAQSGGDFYRNQNARVGKLFMAQVINAAMENQIGFREAYELTGLWGKPFYHYAEKLGVKLS